MSEEERTSNLVTEEELDTIFSGPAFFVNKTYLTASGIMARLTFAEQREGRRPHFRTAVSMTIEDLIKLRNLLDRIAQNVERLEPPSLKKTDG